MKFPLFAFLPACALLVLAGTGLAQVSPDSEKGQDLHRRYQEAVALSQKGQDEAALALFTGILKEEPKAPGSLYFSGVLNLRLGHPDRAIETLAALHALTPDDHKPLPLLIEANQELRRTIRVEEYRKALYALRQSALAAGKTVPGLTDTKNYLREKVYLDGGAQVAFSEFYDPAVEPFIVWEAVELDGQGNMIRDLLLTANPDATAELHKKDPKLADVQIYLFGEFVIKDGKIQQFNLYRQENSLPAYEAFRGWALDAIKQPPKPLQVQVTP
jgi:hypothetical protein